MSTLRFPWVSLTVISGEIVAFLLVRPAGVVQQTVFDVVFLAGRDQRDRIARSQRIQGEDGHQLLLHDGDQPVEAFCFLERSKAPPRPIESFFRILDGELDIFRPGDWDAVYHYTVVLGVLE